MTVPTNPAETLPMSAEGYEYLCRELDTLRDLGRRELGERLRDARGHGDLADNPMLQDLLEEQAQLERRIAILDAQLAAAEIITPAADGRVGIGSVVRARDGEGMAFELELVGPLESDAVNGRVSMHAPVGRALVGGACRCARRSGNAAGERHPRDRLGSRAARQHTSRREGREQGPRVSASVNVGIAARW